MGLFHSRSEKYKNKKGFTLVELMLVIAILGILFTSLFFVVTGHRERARDTNRILAIGKIGESIEISLADGNRVPGFNSLVTHNKGISVSNTSEMHFGEDEELKRVASNVHWRKGKFNQDVLEESATLKTLFTDPKTRDEYDYYVSEDGAYYYIQARKEVEIDNDKRKFFATNLTTSSSINNSNSNGGGSNDSHSSGGSATPPPPPPAPPSSIPDSSVTSNNNCSAGTKEGYNYESLIHGSTQSVSKTENNTPTNGRTNYTAIARCDNGEVSFADIHTSIECNTGYTENANHTCEVSCENPIYLDTNGVTIKAKECAVAGAEYEFNGERYYVARDKEDIKQKIASGYPANRIVTSKVTDMSYLFSGNTTFNQDIGNWDTSNVTSMSNIFHSSHAFNQNIGHWNVSKVVEMQGMFQDAKTFNHNISKWNTSNVLNMSTMFAWASSFNQPIGSWNVSKVNTMEHMFGGATQFNQSLNNWDVSKVTSMKGMFNNATLFNQPLNNWNVSSVTNMGSMFGGATQFNQSLNNWDVSSVSNMDSMFWGASSFNQPLNNWDVSSVTNMNRMFSGTNNFNQNLSTWNTTNVLQMSFMFAGATLFNRNINNWNTSNVISMEGIFENAQSFNQSLNNWDVSSVTNMNRMFNGSRNFNQNLSSWCVRNITSKPSYFDVNSHSGFQNNKQKQPQWGTCPNNNTTTNNSVGRGNTHINITSNTDRSSNIQLALDNNNRPNTIRVRDNRSLRDGVYYKAFSLNLDQETLDSIESATIYEGHFDDWLEVKVNDTSVFSGPHEEYKDLVFCDLSNNNIISELQSEILNLSQTKNYIDNRTLNGNTSIGRREEFASKYKIGHQNNCNNDTNLHIEQWTFWGFRDGEPLTTRWEGHYQHLKDNGSGTFHKISNTRRVYNAKNFKNMLRSGKNIISTSVFVGDSGGMEYTIKFTYKN